MTFDEAVQKLGIEKYADRIFNSNSHGELLHLRQYIVIAETLSNTDWFLKWFEDIIKEAEESWERPESVFQHIDSILLDSLN